MKYLLTALVVITLFACKKEDANCFVPISKDEVFTTEFDCCYQLVNETDTVDLIITNIIDNRELGGGCVVSTGGLAKIQLLVNDKAVEFIWPGCGGDTEPNMNNPTLPTFQIDSLKLRMIKMYPLSKDINSYPALEEYRVKLVIL